MATSAPKNTQAPAPNRVRGLPAPHAMAKPTLTHEVDLHADYSANGDVEHMIQLLLYSDGTVTWQLVDPNGQLIEPPKNQTQ